MTYVLIAIGTLLFIILILPVILFAIHSIITGKSFDLEPYEPHKAMKNIKE